MRTLIPEGSALFFDWPNGVDRQSLIERMWLESVSSIGRHAGFGRVLVGVWGVEN